VNVMCTHLQVLARHVFKLDPALLAASARTSLHKNIREDLYILNSQYYESRTNLQLYPVGAQAESGASVLQANIRVCGVTVHVIDSVLKPPAEMHHDVLTVDMDEQPYQRPPPTVCLPLVTAIQQLQGTFTVVKQQDQMAVRANTSRRFMGSADPVPPLGL
jgi:hypothetical protein